MTTYGDLLDGASEHLRAGAIQLRDEPFWSPDQARTALVDYHGVLDAVASHARRLVWFVRLSPASLSRYRSDLAPFERAAKDLIIGIEALVGTERPHPSVLLPPSTSWAMAARHLRAASDLLATHFRIDGKPCTPDSAAAARFTARSAALSDLAALTLTVLAVEEPLVLRAHQAGLDRRAIGAFLPGLGHLAQLASRTRSDNPALPAHRLPLETLGLTTAPIRHHDPVEEFSDRMRRLRQSTFAITDDSSDSLATLRDVTVVGVAVHAHAAAFHGADLTRLEPPASSTGAGTGALLGRARNWQILGRQLAQFAVLRAPEPVVRRDIEATTRLLPELAQLNAVMTEALDPDPRARRISATLNGAVSTMTEIGEHCSDTFSRLARSGLLRMDARAIPRDVLTGSPSLAESSLHRRIVLAPASVVDRVIGAYDIVREHPIAAVQAASTSQERAAAPDYDDHSILRRSAAQ